MAHKQYTLQNGLKVNIYKRKSNRNLRLSIAPNGVVRVTMPAWAPYQAGLDFAKSKQQWIHDQRSVPGMLEAGQPIGKAHHLYFKPLPQAEKPMTRVYGGAVIVSYPDAWTTTTPAVQAAAQRAAIRALRAQASQLLPQRVATLAIMHNFDYSSVRIKHLKSRWGSCDHRQNIVLNLFLMQLPWEYIDYVILHELTHTQLLKHGPEFWLSMERVLPQVKHLRRELRNFQPILDLGPARLPTLGGNLAASMA